MILLTTIAKAATAAITGTLAVSSAQNIWQTYQISSRVVEESSSQQQHQHQPGVSPFFGKSSADAVQDLQSMKRKELLELFLNSDAPKSVQEIIGDWDGLLLENNSWIMVRI